MYEMETIMSSKENLSKYLDDIDQASDWESSTIDKILLAFKVAYYRVYEDKISTDNEENGLTSNQEIHMIEWMRLDIKGYTELQGIECRKIPGFEIGNSIFELLTLCQYNKIDPFNLQNNHLTKFTEAVSAKYGIDNQAMAKIISTRDDEGYQEFLKYGRDSFIAQDAFFRETELIEPGREYSFSLTDDRLTLISTGEKLTEGQDYVSIDDITKIIQASNEKATNYLTQLTL